MHGSNHAHLLKARVLLLAILSLMASTALANSASNLREAETRLLTNTWIPRYESPENASLLGAADPQATELVQSFQSQASSDSRADLLHVPALDRVSEAAAYYYGQRNSYPLQAYMEWLAWRMGTTGDLVGIRILDLPVSAKKALKENALLDLFPRGSNPEPGTTYGIAMVELERKHFLQVACAFHRPVLVEDLPKEHEPGSSVELKGIISGNYGDPVLFVDGADDILQIPLQPDASGSFSTQLTMPTESGSYFLEIRASAQGEQGKTPAIGTAETLLLLPLYVDTDEPEAPPSWVDDPDEPSSKTSNWPSDMANIYNGLRAERGHGGAVLDPNLTALMDPWAKDLASGTTSGPNPNGSQILSGNGVAHVDLYQSAELFSCPECLAQRLLWRPSFRDQVLNPAMRQMGIAIEPVAGNTDWYSHVALTFLVTPVPGFNQNLEQNRLFAAANRLRRSAGLPAFKQEPRAEAMVHEFGDRVCGGEFAPDDLTELKKMFQVQEYSIGSGPVKLKVYPWMGKSFTEKDIRTNEARFLDEELDYLAIHVCRGSFPDEPNGEYVLVLLVGAD